MKTEMLVNGQKGELISPMDRGFQYGDGLFETILIEAGCVTFLQEHFLRLEKGCRVLGFPLPDRALISEEISSLVSGHQYGVVKITLSRGIGERGFLPPSDPDITRVILFSSADEGVSRELLTTNIMLCHMRLSRQPLLAGIKHLNQLERVLARSELRCHPSAEGLMLDSNEWVIEGVMSNIFMVKDNVLLTPVLDNCGVSGVIRQRLIEQAKKDDIKCDVTQLTLDDIIDADEVFMTNSLMPVRAVDQLMIGDKIFSKKVGTLSEWALKSVMAAIQQQIKGIN